jgi:hypothetical protein
VRWLLLLLLLVLLLILLLLVLLVLVLLRLRLLLRFIRCLLLPVHLDCRASRRLVPADF